MDLSEIRQKAVAASVASRMDEAGELARLLIRLIDEIEDRFAKIEEHLTNAETPPAQPTLKGLEHVNA